MRNLVAHYSLMRVFAISVIGGYLIYNAPFIANIAIDKDSWQALWDKQDGLYNPLLKSLLLAFVQTITLLTFSLVFAILLFRIKLRSSASKYLCLLLIPVVLGNVSVAFLFKLFLLNNPWAFTSPFNKFFTLTCIQFWQYGSLFIYLFWLNQQAIPQSIWDYASAIKINDYEKIRDTLLPKQRNLVLLLFMVAFIFCYYETSKIEFIFKASRGTCFMPFFNIIGDLSFCFDAKT